MIYDRDQFLCWAVLVQESKHIVGPDRASKIAESVAILHGRPKGRVNLELEFFASVPHSARKNPAQRKVVIILGLKEKDWRVGIADAADHQRLKFWRLRPALSATRGINRRTIRTALGTQHRLDSTEGIACHGDPVRINEFLRSQPC